MTDSQEETNAGEETTKVEDIVTQEKQADTKESQTETQTYEEELPATSQESTTLSNDKIEKCIFAWLLSFHVAVMLKFFGITAGWFLLCITLGLASSTAILTFATMKVSAF